jgi:outer membrane protein W
MNSLKVLALATLAIALAPAAFAHDPTNVYDPAVKVVSTVENQYLYTPHASGRVSLVYVSPTGDGDLFGSTAEAAGGWGGSLGWEFRCGHWIGIDLNAIYAKHDIDVGGFGTIGQTAFVPITLGLNVHVTPEKSPVDVFLGPLFGYAMYDDLSAKVDGSTVAIDVDSNFIYGLNLGIEVPAPRHGWAFYASVKYLVTEYYGSLTVDGAGMDNVGVDVDPWIAQAGIAFRY